VQLNGKYWEAEWTIGRRIRIRILDEMENFMKELTGFTMKKVFNYIRSKNVFDMLSKVKKKIWKGIST
jgi:hypothetical protein